MKKRVIIGILICFVLACGCSRQPEVKVQDAEEIWRKIDATMTAQDSFKVNITADLAFTVWGMHMQGEMEVEEIYAKIDRQPYVYEVMKVEVSCDEIDYKEKVKETRAYYDGKMYLANETPNYTRRLCSEMSYGAFENYGTGKQANFSNIDLMDCTDKEFTEKENEWVLQLSGYTKKSMNALIKGASMDDFDWDRTLEDMKIVVVADDQYRVKSMDIEMIFTEGEQDSSMFKVFSRYSDYNQTKDNREVLTQETYTEVEDLCLLDKVTKFLEDFNETESGTCNMTSKLTEEFGKSIREYTEEGQITFVREDNGLSYEMEGMINGQQNFSIIYKDGVQTVTIADDVQEGLLTNDEATYVLEELLNPGQFDTAAVVNITLSKPNEYKFTMAYCSVDMEQNYTSRKGRMDSISQDIYITLEGDKLVRIKSEIRATGVIYSQPVRYTQTNIVEYQ